MTLEMIVEELRKLDIDFALVSQERTAGLGAEQLHASYNSDGLPNHPAKDAWLLCSGIQRALDLCDYNPAFAADLSEQTSKLSNRLANWPGL